MAQTGILKQMKTKTKLIISFLLVTILFVALTIYSNYTTRSIINGYDFAVTNAVGGAFHLDKAKLDLTHCMVLSKDFSITQNMDLFGMEREYLQSMMKEVNEVKILATVNSKRTDLIPVFESIENDYNAYLREIEELEKVASRKNVSPQELGKRLKGKIAALETLDTEVTQIQEAAMSDQKVFISQTLVSAKKKSRVALILTLFVTALAVFLSVIISLSISRPLARATEFSETIAAGDFTSSLELDRSDEIGTLCKSLNTMQKNLIQIITELRETTSSLSTTSGSLATVSSDMEKNAEESAIMATGVSAASEEMSTNVSSVAAAMEQASTNANMVASASEEMSSTINEIAKNTGNARSIVESAVEKSTRAGIQINELGNSAHAIGQVTETITEISEQTNLLALNATIEAARAGEAGKGFAVVANEIKELARQTAEATLDIKTQIEGVQQTTDVTISEIEEISKVIGEINDIVTTIATTVEEQSAATQEIVTNIAQTSTGLQEVNENVNQSAVAAGNITENITKVNSKVQDIALASNNVNTNAKELSELSSRLDTLITRFKL